MSRSINSKGIRLQKGENDKLWTYFNFPHECYFQALYLLKKLFVHGGQKIYIFTFWKVFIMLTLFENLQFFPQSPLHC